MGEYLFYMHMDFVGKDYEMEMMKSLLSLMEVDETNEECEHSVLSEDEAPFDFTIDEAGLHIVRESDDALSSLTGVQDFNWLDSDLTSAPKLFAALFPESSFKYYAELDYSSCNDPKDILAEYNGKTLLIGEYNDLWCWEKLLSLFAKLKCPDGDPKEWIWAWQEEMDHDEDNMWNAILDEYGFEELCKRLELDDFPGREKQSRQDLFIAMYTGWKTIKSPKRDNKYESSFCNEDLLLHLVKAQIKEDKTFISEYLNHFTLSQIMECIEVAQDANAFNVLAELLEYKNTHYSDDNPTEVFVME